MTRGEPELPPVADGFGPATATFVVVSSMVGVGILTTSGLTVRLVGSNALMIGLWAVGGAVALAGALCLAELSAMLPRSGGEYVFVAEAYGPRLAFLSGWASLLLGFAAPIAAASRTASDYLLAPLRLAPATAPVAGVALATALIVGFAATYATARKRTARAQGVVTSVEIGALLAFVALGLVAGRGNFARLDDLPPLADLPVGPLFFSLIYVSYGYTGWNAASYLAGEVADAPRRLPRAILAGTLAVIGLYLAINVVYALALSADDVRAIYRAEQEAGITPIAERAARALFGPRGAVPVALGSGLILVATTGAYLLTGPRVALAMARAGHFPKAAARLSRRNGTPAVATATLAGLALLILWTGSFEAIIVYTGVGLALSSLLSVGALIVLRVRRPDAPRPFRVPAYPLVPLAYLVGTTVVIVAAFVENPRVSTLSAASLLIALPVHAAWTRLAPAPAVETMTETG